MGHIVLTEEQAKSVAASKGNVEVRDPSGRWLGVLSTRGWTQEDLEVARRRAASGGPYYTTEQVLDRLKKLRKS